MRAAVALAPMVAGSAVAQDIAFSPEATESCLAAAGDLAGREACVGRSADAYIDGPDVGTTVGGVAERRHPEPAKRGA